MAMKTPQEIGTHTFSHVFLNDPAVTPEIARAQIKASVERHLDVGDAVLSSVGAYEIEGPGIQLFERIEGDQVYLSQELRDTNGWWFYWNFRVRGAAGRTLTFKFTNGNVFGTQGPAISLDNGLTWSWLRTKTIKGTQLSK